MDRRGRKAGLLIVGSLVLIASAIRFALEIRLILTHCCYDFPGAFGRVLGFATQARALYPPELESYAPGVGDFKYPPLYALLIWLVVVAGLREAPLGPYLFMQIALYLVSVWVLIRAFDVHRQRGLVLLFVAIALNFGPAFETLQRLQIELPLLFCLSLAALCLRQGHASRAGALVATAAMLKLYPGLAALALLSKGRRALVAFGAGLVATTALSLWIFGRVECEHFFLRALPLMSRELPIETYHAENASVARWLTYHLQMNGVAARAWGGALAVVLISTSFLAVQAQRRRDEFADAADLALLVPVMLLALPNSWANYQLLLLVPMAAALGAATTATRTGAASRIGAVLLTGAWLGYHIDTNHYPPELHLPPALSATLHDNRVWMSLLMWLVMLGVVRASRGKCDPATRALSGSERQPIAASPASAATAARVRS